MKKCRGKWISSALFTLGGALVGLWYYIWKGCSAGECGMTANPLLSMASMGVVGWLLSGVWGKERRGPCST